MEDDDCENLELLDLFLSAESQKLLSNTPDWMDSNVFLSEKDAMAADEEDIKQLFDGEMTQEVDDDQGSYDSGTESLIQSTIQAITDQEIKDLPVQELNKLLRDLPRNEAAKIRRRRRNLKNRGYALTCRLRRLRQYEDLENENISLKTQLEDGKDKLRKVWSDKEAYKRKYLLLKRAYTAIRKSSETCQGSPPMASH